MSFQFSLKKLPDDMGEVKCVAQKDLLGVGYDIYDSMSENIRGYILRDKKLVVSNLPYCEEVVIKNRSSRSFLDVIENKNDSVNDSVNDSEIDGIFLPSLEGTFLRVWWDTTWKVSTNNKLDSYNSRWGSNLSFGEMFRTSVNNLYKKAPTESLEYFFETLDQKLVYCFLLKGKRVVCEQSKDKLYYIGFIDVTSSQMSIIYDESPSLIPVLQSVSFLNWESVYNYVREKGYHSIQGLLYYKTDGTVYKLYNETYKKYLDMNQNDPNVLRNYLRLTDPVDINFFRQNYSEEESGMNLLDLNLHKFTCIIYNLYVERYIYKKFILVQGDLHFIISACHRYYINTRIRMNYDTIRNIIKSVVDVSRLFRLLKNVDNMNIYK